MSTETHKTNAEKLTEIDALYSTIPSFKCKPGCADCCGPIHYSRLEFYRCVKASGRSLQQVRDQIQKDVSNNDYRCPFLNRKTNQCSVYAVRPAICRIFGTTGELRCPHGYAPERMLSEESSRAILAQVKELGA
ncbi:MAG: YkgJ family cysteine cluster protein [Gammaproteobacteria bacterium]|nr:YkgJ family cysteine cluster protein [Gammaproteobacteria bacterium]MBU1776047.1 YkgJ family cysteine cluster protein [Gammaproteobacteria bacterium]MBU1969195.1 YkgJ family cysteine cluster protein [Gammaproteobacteria bacterium]